MLFDLIGLDIELTGKRVICVGVAFMKENGAFGTKLFKFPGIKLPTNKEGNPIMDKTGRVDIHSSISCYNDFTEQTWSFWKKRPNNYVLASQIDFENESYSEEKEKGIWMEIRTFIDNISKISVKRGSKIRIVSDNASVDIGIINENLKKWFPEDHKITLDYVPNTPSNTRRHSFVVDSRTPKWQRKLGIIFYKPVKVNIELIQHYAPHDALDSICEYAGYIATYPCVEWPKLRM